MDGEATIFMEYCCPVVSPPNFQTMHPNRYVMVAVSLLLHCSIKAVHRTIIIEEIQGVFG